MTPLSFQGSKEVPTTFLWRGDGRDKPYQLGSGEGEVVVTDDGTSGYSRALSSDQTGAVPMKHVILGFTSI